jgi:hypothetical protein
MLFIHIPVIRNLAGGNIGIGVNQGYAREPFKRTRQKYSAQKKYKKDESLRII